MSKLFFNKRWAFFIAIFAFLIIFGILDFENDTLLSIAAILIGSILLLGYILLFPNSYRLDEKSITVYYGFGIKTVAKWSEIHIIEEHRDEVFLWLKEYHIGYFKSKIPLWQMACIPKNKKATALIEKYYKKSIRKVG